MFAQALAQRLSRAGVHYGWAIVAVISLMSIATLGCVGTGGALITPMSVEFGWGAESISSALGAAAAAWAGGFSRSTFETYLPAFYGAGFACLVAAAAIWLVSRTQGAGEQLIEARA